MVKLLLPRDIYYILDDMADFLWFRPIYVSIVLFLCCKCVSMLFFLLFLLCATICYNK